MANVLIADDSKFMRMLLKKILTPHHNVIGEAENGLEAIEKYDQLKPDVVLMDIIMPEMDGIKTTSMIVNKHKDARVIMCTSAGQNEKNKKGN